ncbi:MFS transporter [Pediococcus stilesii]|uniref:Major facilitator superfamily permease n=1 Tax=Pediococcus stilesii TaxID=331679 RepID=A0A0R2KUV7_9LACO|nr:MFS transporter [Pediococcus stilesii]KRN93232.1 major facilitator superfamily permease [Pediococcus stilesii]
MNQSIKNERQSKPMVVVAIVALMSFMGVLTETSMNVTFPALMREFHVSLSTVQWVTAGYLLMAALVMLTSAYMKRRFTNRQLFTAAAILFSVGDIICGAAFNFPILLIGRLIQSGCVGLCTPLMVNIILDVVPPQKLGTYIGLANLIILVAPAMGPTFGGAVVAFASWRMIFWLTLPLAIILLVMGAKQIKQYSPVENQYAFDWARFIILGLSLVSLIVGLNNLGSGNYIVFGGLILLSIVLTSMFVRLSKNATKALFSLAVFKEKSFLYSFLPYIMLQFANVGINFLLPNYVQGVFQASSLVGGLILLPGSLLNGFGQPIYGWMLDNFGGKLPLYLGDILFTGSLLGLALFGPQLGVWGVTIAYLIFAVGRSMAFGNSVAFGLKHINKDFQNDANALYNTGQQVTGAIGTTVLALLMGSVNRGDYTKAQNISAGSQLAFILLVFFGLIIFMLFYRLLNIKSNQKMS